MITKRDTPEFKSEAEEAQWWDEHREQTAQWMEDAIASGQTTTLSEVLHRHRAIPAVSINMEPEDLTRAQAQAARKGLPYEAYLKALLHRALAQEEHSPDLP